MSPTSNSTFKLKSRRRSKDVPLINDIESRRKEMSDFIDICERQNNIILKDAFNRNIIFVGKTRSGKSTALDVLKSPFSFVKLASIFSETVDASINHFTVEVDGEEGKVNFNISVIDTPGLFEVAQVNTSRDNDALEEIVLRCMKAEITKIHDIFFVVSYNGAINPQDIEALDRFIKLFDGAQSHVHILITKCETFTDIEKEKIKNELTSYPKMRELFKKISSEIFFFGAVEQRLYDGGYVDIFKSNLQNTINMREDLFSSIFGNESHFELQSLKMIDSVRRRAEDLFIKIKHAYENDEVPNPVQFKASCKQLGSWLPLLEYSKYDEANSLLIKCEQKISDLENLVNGVNNITIDIVDVKS